MESFSLSRILFSEGKGIPCHSCFKWPGIFTGRQTPLVSLLNIWNQNMPSLDWKEYLSHLGVDGCPQVGNVNVCPRSVGVSVMSSCIEHFSHWVGESGIPQKFLVKILMSIQIFWILTMVVRCLYSLFPEWEARSPQDHLFCCQSPIIRYLKTDWSKSSLDWRCVNVYLV